MRAPTGHRGTRRGGRGCRWQTQLRHAQRTTGTELGLLTCDGKLDHAAWAAKPARYPHPRGGNALLRCAKGRWLAAGTTIAVGGELSRIALQSEKRDNATVFEVEIDVREVPVGVLLRAGYSANADIIVRRVAEALALRERVLVFRSDSTFVRLPAAEGEEPEERAIDIGMSDGISVQVVGGLDSGDVVLDKETREIE